MNALGRRAQTYTADGRLNLHPHIGLHVNVVGRSIATTFQNFIKNHNIIFPQTAPPLVFAS